MMKLQCVFSGFDDRSIKERLLGMTFDTVTDKRRIIGLIPLKSNIGKTTIIFDEKATNYLQEKLKLPVVEPSNSDPIYNPSTNLGRIFSKFRNIGVYLIFEE